MRRLPRDGRVSTARASACTSHELTETPSRAAAASTLAFSVSGSRSVIRADVSSAANAERAGASSRKERTGSPASSRTSTRPDGSCAESFVRRLRDRLEQVEPERRAERGGDAANRVRLLGPGGLGHGREVGLDGVDVQ